MCRWCTRTCFQGSGTGGCEELCLVEGDHHELVLLGEEHGQGGVWAGCHEEFVVGQFCKDRGCDELGSVGVFIMYEDYRGREVVLCQVMELCGQWL